MVDPTYAHDAQCNSPHEAGPDPCPPAVTRGPEPEDVPATVNSWVSQYTVSFLPRDHPRVQVFAVKVMFLDSDQWIVLTHGGGEIWSTPNRSTVSYRILTNDPEWMEAYVFDFTTAMRLARRVAAIRTVNGLTALDVLAKEGESHDEHAPVDSRDVVPEPDPDPEGPISAGPPYTGRHRPALDADLQPELSAGVSYRGD